VSGMEDICRDADRAFKDLDPSDSGVFDDGIEITQDALDSMDQLRPPQDLEGDFEDFKDNLDDHITQIEKLRDAVKDEDNDAAEQASAKLSDLDDEADDLADSMGADRCVGVGEDDDGSDDTVPEETTPNTPLPIDTTPVETSPPDTEAPTTEPDVTNASDVPGSAAAVDASVYFNAPDGYTWAEMDLTQVDTPADDPTLGPILNAYYAGTLDSTTGGPSVAIYIIELTQNTEWTQEQLDAYYASEFLTDGTDTTTPLGLPVRLVEDPTTGVDNVGFTIDGGGVALFGPSGTDLLNLLDAFVSAQPSG
jgi:hypothetical protein